MRREDAPNVSNVEHLHGGGVGALLKASRVRVDEQTEDVATDLRISRRYIEAIEEGRFDVLPGRTYAIGFVRAYADHLGLDADEVVRRFKLECEDTQKGPDLHFPEPIPESKVPGAAIVMIGALLASAAYGGWYFSTGRDEPALEAVAPVPEVVGEQSVTEPSIAETAETATTTDEPAEATAAESVETAVTSTVAAVTEAATNVTDSVETSVTESVAEVENAVTEAVETTDETSTTASETVDEPITEPVAEVVEESANVAAPVTEEAITEVATTSEQDVTEVVEPIVAETAEVAEAV